MQVFFVFFVLFFRKLLFSFFSVVEDEFRLDPNTFHFSASVFIQGRWGEKCKKERAPVESYPMQLSVYCRSS